MAANDGEHPITSLFGVAMPDGTGAPGTQGAASLTDVGSAVGVALIARGDTYESGQLPRERVTVYAGDTSGMSDDLPAHVDAIMPGPLGGYMSTGAGEGDTGSHYPRYDWQEGPR